MQLRYSYSVRRRGRHWHCADTRCGYSADMRGAGYDDFRITKEVAEAQAKAYMVGNFGKMLAGELSKLVPIFGSATNATVAVGLTEYLGWEVAEDFYKKSLEENRILKEAQNKPSKL